MKKLFLTAALMVPNFAMAADAFILGAGAWTCEDVIAADESKDMAKVFQAAGWLFGYWSAETAYRSDTFVNIVQQAGGQAIYQQTLVECAKAPAGTLLYQLAGSMISNTE